MRGAGALWLALAICLGLASPVGAADEAQYNFASAQADKRIRVAPGGEGRGRLYFYNVDGNRVTHVLLAASGLPAGWQIGLEPAPHLSEFVVDGRTHSVQENLFLEPTQLLSREDAEVAADSVCIGLPGRGFVVAKVAEVVVRAPAEARVGALAGLTVRAEASWLGQPGAAVLKQARDFDFVVEVVPAASGYRETKVLAQSAGGAAPSNGGGEPPASDLTSQLLPAGIGALCAGLLGYGLGRRGRRTPTS